MKNNFLTHKFLPILSVFLLAVFVLCTNVFASSSEVVTFYNSSLDKDITLQLPDFSNETWLENPTSFKYYVITYYPNDNFYKIYFADSPYVADPDRGNRLVTTGKCFAYNVDNFNISDTNISYSNARYYNSEGICDGYSFNPFVGNNCIAIYSSYDILDSNGELVFQGAPQEQEVTQVELMKPIQVQEIPQQIAGILAIALPIFLAIFGVLLLLYLLKSKNLLNQ